VKGKGEFGKVGHSRKSKRIEGRGLVLKEGKCPRKGKGRRLGREGVGYRTKKGLF